MKTIIVLLSLVLSFSAVSFAHETAQDPENLHHSQEEVLQVNPLVFAGGVGVVAIGGLVAWWFLLRKK